MMYGIILLLVITYFLNLKGEEIILNAMPSLTEYSALIEKHSILMMGTESEEVQLKEEYIIRQLLLLGECQDFSDELGRRNYLNTLRK